MAALTMTPLFRETQSFWNNGFVRWTVGLAAVFSVAVVGYASVAEGSMIVLVWTLLGCAVVALLVGRLRLDTELTDAGLRVRLWPFPSATYAWTDIASAEVRTYRPLLDYGGWGLRFGPKGMAWNAYGTEGVQLVLRSGRRVLVGSQRADELAEEIRARLS